MSETGEEMRVRLQARLDAMTPEERAAFGERLFRVLTDPEWDQFADPEADEDEDEDEDKQP